VRFEVGLTLREVGLTLRVDTVANDRSGLGMAWIVISEEQKYLLSLASRSAGVSSFLHNESAQFNSLGM